MALRSSNVSMNRYKTGHDILLKSPSNRKDHEVLFLREWLAKNVPLFSKIPSDNLVKIADNVRLQMYQPYEVVYEQGNIVPNFHVVIRGSLSVLLDQRYRNQGNNNNNNSLGLKNNEMRKLSNLRLSNLRLSNRRFSNQKLTAHKTNSSSRGLYGEEMHKLHPGDFFGEEALLEKDEIATHTVRASEEVELLAMHGAVFDQALHSYFQDLMLKRAEFVVGLEWFRDWNPHMIRQLVFIMREKEYTFGECLYRQEMKTHQLEFIKTGAVQISTYRKREPPNELLKKIEPPKDYLPEILAEDLPVEKITTTSRVGLNGQQNSKVSSDLLARATNKTVSKALNETTSTSLLSKMRANSIDEQTKEETETVGFKVHPPNPDLVTNVCILGPKDTLRDIEALCKLDHHLFNAVCVTDTSTYEINRRHFHFLFEILLAHTYYLILSREIQRVEMWSLQHKEIQIFVPLLKYMNQLERNLFSEGAHKAIRKKPLYTTSMLAYTAVKGLGKMTIVEENGVSTTTRSGTERRPVFLKFLLPTPESSPESTPLLKRPESPPPEQVVTKVHSPFEPECPDYGMQLSFYMRHMMNRRPSSFSSTMASRPARFSEGESSECIFDSPIKVTKNHSIPILQSAHIKKPIPVPSPYPSLPNPKSRLYLEPISKTNLKATKSVFSFDGVNPRNVATTPSPIPITHNSDHLARIRMHILSQIETAALKRSEREEEEGEGGAASFKRQREVSFHLITSASVGKKKGLVCKSLRKNTAEPYPTVCPSSREYLASRMRSHDRSSDASSSDRSGKPFNHNGKSCDDQKRKLSDQKDNKNDKISDCNGKSPDHNEKSHDHNGRSHDQSNSKGEEGEECFVENDEATTIPQEYSNLCAADKRGEGSLDEESTITDSSIFLPYVKTMPVSVTENKSSHLLTRFRHSLAVTTSVAQHKNTPKQASSKPHSTLARTHHAL